MPENIVRIRPVKPREWSTWPQAALTFLFEAGGEKK